MNWAATQAKAKFSEVLDRAESEGPQVVLRRKREFVVMTREQLGELKIKTHRGKKREIPSARSTMAEFFRNSPLRGLDIDFERIDPLPRHVKF